MIKNNDLIYYEEVSSNRTELLFIALTILFLILSILCATVSGWNGFAVAFLVFSCFFLFYSTNYRILLIHITREAVKLSFGIFSWIIPLDNIENCSLDEIPTFMKYGGAGIHFMLIRKRYRASFNFLEHPRVVIAFKRKVGPVRDISFSTRRPEEMLQVIQEAIHA